MMIRPIQSDDAPYIGQLWAQLVAYHRTLDEAMPKSAAHGAEFYAARIASLTDDPHARTYVALENNERVGYITGMILDMRPEMFEEEISGIIGDIFVVETHRKQGVGQALVRAMEGFFASRGIAYYEWFVASANTEGQAFWQKMHGRSIVVRMRAYLNES